MTELGATSEPTPAERPISKEAWEIKKLEQEVQSLAAEGERLRALHDLEVDKIKAETAHLNKSLWRTATFWGVLSPAMVAAAGLLFTWASGWFNTQNDKLAAKNDELTATKQKLDYDLERLNDEKTKLQATTDALVEERNRLIDEREAEVYVSLVFRDLSKPAPSLRSLDNLKLLLAGPRGQHARSLLVRILSEDKRPEHRAAILLALHVGTRESEAGQQLFDLLDSDEASHLATRHPPDAQVGAFFGIFEPPQWPKGDWAELQDHLLRRISAGTDPETAGIILSAVGTSLTEVQLNRRNRLGYVDALDAARRLLTSPDATSFDFLPDARDAAQFVKAFSAEAQ
jgi:hypothetical protein